MKKVIYLSFFLSFFLSDASFAIKSPKKAKIKKTSIQAKKKKLPTCPPDCRGTDVDWRNTPAAQKATENVPSNQ
jgi:hypothetical protein